MFAICCDCDGDSSTVTRSADGNENAQRNKSGDPVGDTRIEEHGYVNNRPLIAAIEEVIEHVCPFSVWVSSEKKRAAGQADTPTQVAAGDSLRSPAVTVSHWGNEGKGHSPDGPFCLDLSARRSARMAKRQNRIPAEAPPAAHPMTAHQVPTVIATARRQRQTPYRYDASGSLDARAPGH